RVRATYEAILDPNRYEAFAYDALSKKYRWQRADKPTHQADEQRLLKEGKLAAALARYQLVDATTGTPVRIHGASINWNDYRKKWIMIALQSRHATAPSLLPHLPYA